MVFWSSFPMFCWIARASAVMPKLYKTYRFLHVFRMSPLPRTSRFTQAMECADISKKHWTKGLQHAKKWKSKIWAVFCCFGVVWGYFCAPLAVKVAKKKWLTAKKKWPTAKKKWPTEKKSGPGKKKVAPEIPRPQIHLYTLFWYTKFSHTYDPSGGGVGG